MTDAPVVDVRNGDCRELIAAMPSESVDAIVTDPPYELGFMGKGWDASGIAYDVTLWSECLRVLKPGGYLLAFGGTRTYHRMACAIEDAGFEIRDAIYWLYSSGFPKSLDISKAIDKAAGAKRTVQIGTSRGVAGEDSQGYGGIARGGVGITQKGVDLPVMAPATDDARKWQGFGTALKPAHEPIVLARKPLTGTVAANVLEHGTGALNVDGARVGDEAQINTYSGRHAFGDSQVGEEYRAKIVMGRWPANVITDGSIDAEWVRYFYSAKASKAERNAGLNALPATFAPTMNNGIGGKEHDPETATPKQNTHPTVKPLALMRYLVRLVTPPGGTVLEPFAGSGTTLAAAVLEGFNAIGCELTEDYLPIIAGRVQWAQQERANKTESLFPE